MSILQAILLCIVLLTTPVIATTSHAPRKVTTKKIKAPKAYLTGIVTVYAKRFEGRRTASGTRFTHRGLTFASRHGCRFGRRMQISYHGNKVIAMRTDTGGLPLDRPNRRQLDITQAVAKRLGLYQKVRGKADRLIKYRWLD